MTIAEALARWVIRYGLTLAEETILESNARGVPRSHLAQLRGVAPSTIKKQCQNLLRRTGDASLDAACVRLLREAVDGTPVGGRAERFERAKREWERVTGEPCNATLPQDDLTPQTLSR